jgi:hypothetical protein
LLSDAVYEESYGWKRVDVQLPARFFEIPRLSGGRTWATAPYLTDDLKLSELTSSELTQWDHILSEALAQRKIAEAVIKSRSPDLANFVSPSGSVVDRGFVTSLLDLKMGSEHLFEKVFHTKRRQQIRRAMGHHPQISIRPLSESLDPFFDVWSKSQRELGTPSHSIDFFRSIAKHHADRSWVALGVIGTRTLAAALLIEIGGKLYHPFIGTLREANSSYLNVALYWEIIRWACDQGFSEFDFGRSFVGSGVHDFKKYWGVRTIPLTYFHCGQKNVPNLKSPAYNFATKCWRYLPLPLTREFGPLLIRRMP